MKSSCHLVTVLTISGVFGCSDSAPQRQDAAALTAADTSGSDGVPPVGAAAGSGGAPPAGGASDPGGGAPGGGAPAGGASVSGAVSAAGAEPTPVAAGTLGGSAMGSGSVVSNGEALPGETSDAQSGAATSTDGAASTGAIVTEIAISTTASSSADDPTSTGGAPGIGAGGSADPGTTDTSAGGASGPPVKKFVGNISPKNQDIPADFASKWMQVTMEANSKWGFVQPNSAEDWVWEPVDQAYQYAKDNGVIFKEHCFFWNFEQPSWVNNDNVATVAPIWIQNFCERYPDVAMIDVVNEFLHNKAPYRDGMGGEGATGHDWVLQAFQWARQYCPNATLILNDFNIIEYDNDHESFVSALQTLLDAGAPIDAIGAQGHDVYKVGAEKAKTYLDNLADTFHLPIYITEVDIDLADDAEQLASMQEEITMFWDHPSVHGITYWGFLKGSTWRTNAWLVDQSGNERPAMTWLQEFIAAHR